MAANNLFSKGIVSLTALALLVVAGSAAAGAGYDASAVGNVVSQTTATAGASAALPHPSVVLPEAGAKLDYYAKPHLDENVKAVAKAKDDTQVGLALRIQMAIDAATKAASEAAGAVEGVIGELVGTGTSTEGSARAQAEAQAAGLVDSGMNAKADAETTADGVIGDAHAASGDLGGIVDGTAKGAEKGLAQTNVDWDLTAKFEATVLGLLSFGK